MKWQKIKKGVWLPCWSNGVRQGLRVCRVNAQCPWSLLWQHVDHLFIEGEELWRESVTPSFGRGTLAIFRGSLLKSMPSGGKHLAQMQNCRFTKQHCEPPTKNTAQKTPNKWGKKQAAYIKPYLFRFDSDSHAVKRSLKRRECGSDKCPVSQGVGSGAFLPLSGDICHLTFACFWLNEKKAKEKKLCVHFVWGAAAVFTTLGG